MVTRTAAQRRSDAKGEFDAYLATCPSRQLLGIIGEKWAMLVICRLGEGSLRFSELERELPGISAKMLTQTVRRLEHAGLVDRTVTASVPPRVDYALTELGRSLLEPIAAVKAWAERHMPDIEAARERSVA